MHSSRGIIRPCFVHVLSSYDSSISIVFIIPEDGGSGRTPTLAVDDFPAVAVQDSDPEEEEDDDPDPDRSGKVQDALFLFGVGRQDRESGPEIRDS